MTRIDELPVKVEAALSSAQSVDVKSCVEKLLHRTPPEYLAGLSMVVLRDQGGLDREERRHRKSRLKRNKVILGLYYRETSTRPARIELFADEICNRWPSALMRIPPLRDVLIGSTLFHEIGHHIHQAIIPGHGDPEVAANLWRRKLIQHTMKRHAWYVLPILRAAHRLLSLARAKA